MVTPLGKRYNNYHGNAVAARGKKEIVQILLDRTADVNTPGGIYGNALQAAAATGKEGTVQILVDKEG